MTGPIDTATIPRGEVALLALVDAVVGADEAEVERHFLEVKSEIDVVSKEGLGKIAKFILGAANRMPDVAAPYFGGHAVMLLGVGAGGVCGVNQFEAKDLAEGLRPYLSAGEPPRWDFQRLEVDGRRVVAIIVDPPAWGDPIYTCYKEGVGLKDGDILFRADGQTRRAVGEEIRLLREREKRSAARPVTEEHLEISLFGTAHPVYCSEDLLPWFTRYVRKALGEPQAVREASGHPFLKSSSFNFSMDNREPHEFLDQLRLWEANVRVAWPQIVSASASGLPPIELCVHNTTQRFLDDVEVELDVIGPVFGVEHWPEPTLDSVLPKRPRKWKSIVMTPRFNAESIFRSVNEPQFENSDDGVHLVYSLGSLRPGARRITQDEDCVLVATGEPGELLRCSWKLTSRTLDGTISGTFEQPIGDPEDLRDLLRNALVATASS